MTTRISKFTALLFIAAVMAAAIGCSDPPEVIARNVIASAKGVIEESQVIYLGDCQANPALKQCAAINKAVAAQNAAIDALEIYCGSPEFEAGGACTPHSSAESKLRQAVQQLDDVIKQLKVLAPERSSRQPVAGSQSVQPAGIGDGSLLGMIDLVLMILGPLVGALVKNPAYSAVVAGIQAAIRSLEQAKDEIVTKQELEGLRTAPKW